MTSSILYERAHDVDSFDERSRTPEDAQRSMPSYSHNNLPFTPSWARTACGRGGLLNVGCRRSGASPGRRSLLQIAEAESPRAGFQGIRNCRPPGDVPL
jgi:hypothetical protein